MSKSTGLGNRYYFGGYALHGDINAVSRIGGGPAAMDLTGIDKSAHERVGGLRDGALDVVSWFNKAAGQSHPVFKALPTADVIGTWCHRSTIGSVAASINAKQANYDPTRAADGSLSSAVGSMANQYGLEFGNLVTAATRTDTGAANGASVDFGVGSTAFGLQAYLQVVGFTGTDATIKLQQSSDDGGADAFADVTGGGFTAVTAAPGAQRIQTARGQTVERYLRVVTTTSAGFTSLEFLVMVNRNDTEVLF